jgi:hypothetical protein
VTPAYEQFLTVLTTKRVVKETTNALSIVAVNNYSCKYTQYLEMIYEKSIKTFEDDYIMLSFRRFTYRLQLIKNLRNTHRHYLQFNFVHLTWYCHITHSKQLSIHYIEFCTSSQHVYPTLFMITGVIAQFQPNSCIFYVPC